VTLGWTILTIALFVPAAVLAVVFWSHLLRLRRAVRHLANEGTLVDDVAGLSVAREIYQELRRIEVRQRVITQQIAAEEFSLRAILSSMVEGVLITNPDLRIRLTNERLQQMFLLSRDPVGRTVLEVFRNHLLQQVIERTLRTEQPQIEEVEIRGPDQLSARHFQVTSVGLRPRENEPLAGTLVVFHDLTQLKSLESVRKEFVANVSHELRTPLSIITGYLETLLEGAEDEETSRRFLKIMHKHSQRLHLLVEDLLALSQLESRQLSLYFESIDLRECVDRVLERFDSMIEEIGAIVSVNLPASLPKLEADPLRLEQVVFNLVENALKYGGPNGLKLEISAICDGRDVIVRFKDNGPGIPLSDQPHVFERFYRVHKDRSRDAGGTGLGLSIVKHTIQAHGGSVVLESTPGAGATFTIRLPVCSAPGPGALQMQNRN
jgi:two-component system, OmpR family, phosphate regulon sensor histidine kinase PhoR